MKNAVLGYSNFYLVSDLQLALHTWHRETSAAYVYGPNGEQITGFAVIEETLSDGSKVANIHFIKERTK